MFFFDNDFSSIITNLYIVNISLIFKKRKMELKQVILVREDLKLPKGKLAVQAAHAACDALLKSHKETVMLWRRQGMKKVVLKINTEKELFEFKMKAEQMGFITAVISDAGRTVVEPGTNTCLGIGPDEEEKIDMLTGKLKMV